MKTNTNITGQLERTILANALNIFRKIDKVDYVDIVQNKIVLRSSINGFIFDEVVIDKLSWKIFQINYQKEVNGTILNCSIIP